MDCLLIDECTQLSAQLFSILDIILQNLRHNSLRTFTCFVTVLPFCKLFVLSNITLCLITAFEGVLIFGALDHSQIGAIDVSECVILE